MQHTGLTEFETPSLHETPSFQENIIKHGHAGVLYQFNIQPLVVIIVLAGNLRGDRSTHRVHQFRVCQTIAIVTIERMDASSYTV